MTLNRHFALNSVSRRYDWGSDTKAGFRSLATLKLVANVDMLSANFKPKKQLRHRAVSILTTARLSCSLSLRDMVSISNIL